MSIEMTKGYKPHKCRGNGPLSSLSGDQGYQVTIEMIGGGSMAMFDVGDKVVYPMHGAGVIEAVEEREILGEKQRYYILRIPMGDMRVMVPPLTARMTLV